MRKVYSLLLILSISFILVSSISVAWETNLIESVEPDTFNRIRDTRVLHSLFSNINSDFNLTGYAIKPNGSVVTLDNYVGNIKADNGRDFGFVIHKEDIDEYGEWIFRVNESVQGESTQIEYEIIPQVTSHLSLPSYIHTNTQHDMVHILVEVVVEDFIDLVGTDEIIPGNASIYIYNETGQNRTLVYTEQLGIDSPYSLDTNIYINSSNLQAGLVYEVITNFNISSCQTCENYTFNNIEQIYVKEDYASLTYLNKWNDSDADQLETLITENNLNITQMEKYFNDTNTNINNSEQSIIDRINVIDDDIITIPKFIPQINAFNVTLMIVVVVLVLILIFVIKGSGNPDFYMD